MAYPTISGPYGLKPTGKIGGRADNGANRHISIASGYATDIFFGDPVGLTAAGTIEFETPDAAMAPVGVFLGCFYTDATNGPTYSQYWPASTTASDAVAYVCDDPDQLFKVAVVSSGTTIGDFALTDVGLNAAMVDNTGSTVPTHYHYVLLISSKKLKIALVVLLKLLLSGTLGIRTIILLAYRRLNNGYFTRTNAERAPTGSQCVIRYGVQALRGRTQRDFRI